MKTVGIVITVLLVISPSIAFAHPDFMGAKIQWSNHTEIPYTINQIKKTNSVEIEYEIFSVPWFWQNFIFILSAVIVAIMIPFSVIIYKE